MKRKNCVKGQRVVVKANSFTDDVCCFFAHRIGVKGTVDYMDSDGDVMVDFDDGKRDVGHHRQLRKVKGEQA